MSEIRGNMLIHIRPTCAQMMLTTAVLGLFTAGLIINVRWEDFKVVDQPLHAAIEAMGAICSIFMAPLLLQRTDEEYGGKFFLIAMGFLAMGILDSLHAVSAEGHGLTMLHGLSNVMGSLFFSLTLIPAFARARDSGWKKMAPWLIAGGSIFLGILTLAGKPTMPVMTHNGEYTATARVIHFMAGVLFTGSAVGFIIDYYRYRKPEISLFVLMAILFGSAGFSYTFSNLWNLTWWLWHILRLAAYFLVLGYMLLDIKRTEKMLRQSNQLSVRRLAELQSLYTTAPVGLCFVDTELRIVKINQMLSEIIGVQASACLGQTISELLPAVAEILEPRCRQVLETGAPIAGREFHGAAPGHPDVERDWLVNYYPVRDEASSVWGVNVVVQDVTDLKRAGEVRSLLSTIVESSEDAIISKTFDGIIRTWNLGAEKIFGYLGEEVIGRHYSIFGFLDPAEIDGIVETIKMGEHIERYQTSGVRKDGRQICVSLNFSPIKDTAGGLIGVSTIGHDITKYKAREDEIKHLSRQNELILESVDEGILGLDSQGNHTFINSAAADMLGYARDELFGKHSHPLWHHTRADGSPYPENECHVYQTLRDGVIRRIDHEFFWKKDGTSFPVEYDTTPILEGETITGTVVAFRDITERKRVEEALRESEEKYKALVENANSIILKIDTEANITFFNEFAQQFFGFGKEEIISRNVINTIVPEIDSTGRNLADMVREVLAHPELYQTNENENIKKSGERAWVLWKNSITHDREGKFCGFLCVGQDITDRKRAEEALSRALTELERSNSELKEFAYVASHDLQEPLRMVSSFLQLVEAKYKGKLDEKADRYIAFAVDGALRMQRLIEDLLEYSRLFRETEFKPVDLNQVMTQTLANLSAVVRESGAVVTSDDLPTVSGNETQLMQLFQNLISNAIKFRKPDIPPLVHVTAGKKGNQWLFSVRDQGIGIGPEYFDRIFQIFQRLHTREEYPGTGIGLTLCKKIVEFHHGRIWLESVPGEGTTFFFTIPIARGGTK